LSAKDIEKTMGKQTVIIMRKTHKQWKELVFRQGATGYAKKYILKEEPNHPKAEETGPFGERWLTVLIDGKNRRVRLRRKFEWERELERVSNNW